MKRFLASLFGPAPKSRDPVRRADGRRARPQLEALEGRRMPALVGPSFQVNPSDGSTLKAQSESAVASSSNGMTVAVWTHEFSSTDHDIHARLYDAGGGVVKDIVVAGSANDDSDPSVAMDGHGNFVVTWTQQVGNQWDVMARRYANTGDSRGIAFHVTTSNSDEFDSDVAMDAGGDFVVSYTQNFGTDNVRAARFNSSGVFQGDTKVAGLAGVEENESSVAITPDGRFVVAYTSEADGSNNANVLLDRFNAAGTKLNAAPIPIATTNAYEEDPGVAVDANGNAVVAFQTFTNGDVNIHARRVSNSGSVGGVVLIATRGGGVHELNPEVGLSNSGAFVVGYDFYGPADNFASHVGLAEVSSGNQVTDVNLGSAHRSQPAITMNGSGDYFLTYTSEIFGEVDIRGRRGRL